MLFKDLTIGQRFMHVGLPCERIETTIDGEGWANCLIGDKLAWLPTHDNVELIEEPIEEPASLPVSIPIDPEPKEEIEPHASDEPDAPDPSDDF